MSLVWKNVGKLNNVMEFDFRSKNRHTYKSVYCVPLWRKWWCNQWRRKGHRLLRRSVGIRRLPNINILGGILSVLSLLFWRRPYFRSILWDLGVRSLVILGGSIIEWRGALGKFTSVGVPYLHRPHSDIFTPYSLKTHYITLSLEILHFFPTFFIFFSL